MLSSNMAEHFNARKDECCELGKEYGSDSDLIRDSPASGL